MEIRPPPLLKIFATPLPALVEGEENLVIGFGRPPFTLEMLPPLLMSHVGSGRQVTFKKELVAVTSYFAKKVT